MPDAKRLIVMPTLSTAATIAACSQDRAVLYGERMAGKKSPGLLQYMVMLR
jgi:hypothetical protein